MSTLKSLRHTIALIHAAHDRHDSIKCKLESDAEGRYTQTTASKIERHNNNISESTHRWDAQTDRGELGRLIDIMRHRLNGDS